MHACQVLFSACLALSGAFHAVVGLVNNRDDLMAGWNKSGRSTHAGHADGADRSVTSTRRLRRLGGAGQGGKESKQGDMSASLRYEVIRHVLIGIDRATLAASDPSSDRGGFGDGFDRPASSGLAALLSPRLSFDRLARRARVGPWGRPARSRVDDDGSHCDGGGGCAPADGSGGGGGREWAV